MENFFDRLVRSWEGKDVRKDDVERNIRRIQKEIDNTDPGSEKMTKLEAQMEQALKNKKLYRESRGLGLDPNTVFMGLLLTGISALAFSLDLEIPGVLKHAGYITKLPMARLHF